MAKRSRVAVIKVKPETILDDVARLCELAGMTDALQRGATTILKDNISWHYPFPAANTTPWQLEGTILALRRAGFGDITAVQNKTVVTDAFRVKISTITSRSSRRTTSRSSSISKTRT